MSKVEKPASKIKRSKRKFGASKKTQSIKINLTLTADNKSTLVKATKLAGVRSINEFVINCALNVAQDIIEGHKKVVL
ncbi:hypothetical protein BH09BAC3_BH09BAC3_12680 [soil metagenome]